MHPTQPHWTLFLVVLGGPLVLGAAAFFVRRREPAPAAAVAPWDWALVAHSTLLYTLAFNLTFFLQELFLVVPKALTPGLQPTLFHNNHSWSGTNPLAALFQGTGALVIFLGAGVGAWVLARRAKLAPTGRLFCAWMVFHGFLQSLPQVALGGVSSGGDVGMAMTYLQLGPTTKIAASLAALVAMPFVGLALTRPLLELAPSDAAVATPRGRAKFIANLATVPALLAIPLIILYRVPRETIEVVAPPIAVALLGAPWLQTNAWRVTSVRTKGSSHAAWRMPAIACLALLLFFHLVLRPGVKFY
ncbi:MAG: hypothetical protein C0518_07910 [Opitutus sp.]|nr:hypothetical protein [Opitutus sp.]